MAHRSPSQLSACSSSSSSSGGGGGSVVDSSPASGRANPFTIDYILSNAAVGISKQQQVSADQVHVDDGDEPNEQAAISGVQWREAQIAASQQVRQSSAALQTAPRAPLQHQQQQQHHPLLLPSLVAEVHRQQQQQQEQTKQVGGQQQQSQQQDANVLYVMAYMLLQQQQQQQQCQLIAQQQQLAARLQQQHSASVASGNGDNGTQHHSQQQKQQQQQQSTSQTRQQAAPQTTAANTPMDNLAMLAQLTANPLTRRLEAGASFKYAGTGSIGKARASSSVNTAGPQPPLAPHDNAAHLNSNARDGPRHLMDQHLADIFSGLKQRVDGSAANGANTSKAHPTLTPRHFSLDTALAAQHKLPQQLQQLQHQQQLQRNICTLAQTLAYPSQPARLPQPPSKRNAPYASLIGHSKPVGATTSSILNDTYQHPTLLNQQLNSAPALTYSGSPTRDAMNSNNNAPAPAPMLPLLQTSASQQAALRAHHLAQLPTQQQLKRPHPDESLKRDRGRPAKAANGEQNIRQNNPSPLSPPSNPTLARANSNTNSSSQRSNGSGQVGGGAKVDNLKPAHSYIGLIAMCILSSREKRMVLSDIYRFILHHYPYYRNRGNGWRNSVRHNLSLNECFQKSGRAENGKGHYWTIHPANMEDFMNGDFRRRRAQRKVRRWNLLDVPSDESDDESVEPESSRPPLPEHFKRSIEMHRQLELVLQGSCAFEAFRAAAAANSIAPSSRYPDDANCAQQIESHNVSSSDNDAQSMALMKNKSPEASESVGDDMVDVEQDRDSSTTSPMSSTMDEEEELSVCAGCDESGDGMNTTTASHLVSPIDATATTPPSTMPTTTSSSSTTSAVATDSDFIHKAAGILCEHE